MFLQGFFTRNIVSKCHRLPALVLGPVFALLGLTGSIAVYHQAFDLWLNPGLQVAAAGRPMLSPDRLLAAVRAAEPERYGVWTLELPQDPQQPLVAWFDRPRETLDEFYAPLMVAVDPYSGQVLASRLWGRTLATWLLDLHSQLLLGADGPPLLAAAGVLLLLTAASGIYLWWPGWRGLPAVLWPRPGRSLQRNLLALHLLLGAIGAGPLLVLAFTGSHLAQPRVLESLADASGMGHDIAEGDNVHSSAQPNDRPVSLTEAVLIARGLFPSAEVRRITTPRGGTGTYRINLRQSHELNQRHPLTTVWIDRWSGQIRDVRNPLQLHAGQAFVGWLWPLHTGEAFGAGARAWWCLAGLLPLLLYLGGLGSWLLRRGIVADRQLDWPAARRRLQAALRAGAGDGMALAQRRLPQLRRSAQTALLRLTAAARPLWQQWLARRR